MSNVILGRVTETSALVWLQGAATAPLAHLHLYCVDPTKGRRESERRASVRLERRQGFVSVHAFRDLHPGTKYELEARFVSPLPRVLQTLADRLPRDAREAIQHVSMWLLGRNPFPHPERSVKADFSTHTRDVKRLAFLLGSCNLSPVKLSNAIALAEGVLGYIAGRRSAQALPTYRPGLIGWIASGVVRALQFLNLAVTLALTTYRQPRLWRSRDALRPFGRPLASPFEILKRYVDGFTDEGGERGPSWQKPAFMLHVGDQIYYDFPRPSRAPRRSDYEKEYALTWFDDRAMARFLCDRAQYMMLDDHEIVDGFGTHLQKQYFGRSRSEYAKAAIPAYRRFVHARHAEAGTRADEGGLYYELQLGKFSFFVMDTRTERDVAARRMIGPGQLERLRSWLQTSDGQVRFIVSSVPFLAHLRVEDAHAGDEKMVEHAHITPTQRRRDSDDKWCGTAFSEQRDQILAMLYGQMARRVVFLVGDMHCCYHAVAEIGPPGRRITVHELAGGPISQLQFSYRSSFAQARCDELDLGGESVKVRTHFRRFDGNSPGVLHLSVEPSQWSADECDEYQINWSMVRLHLNFAARAENGDGDAELGSGDEKGPTRLAELPVGGHFLLE